VEVGRGLVVILGSGCRRSDAPFLAMDFSVGAGCCITVDQGGEAKNKVKAHWLCPFC
jgi:hypothetical protein